jgi:hypothetical protein
MTTPLLAAFRIASGLLILLTTSCKQFTVQDEASRRIEAFKNDRFEWVMLGTPRTLGTTNTEYVLAHPNESRLKLIQALKDRKHPMKVGLAAYCLRKMKDRGGLQEASKAIECFSKRKGRLSANESFAQNELYLYVECFDAPSP